jgi:hypothetical protein
MGSGMGRGTVTYVNDEKYEGQFRYGKQHGRGIYTFVNGETYEGHWKKWKRHGKGVVTYAKGETYEGHWKKGRRHGWGTLTVNGQDYTDQDTALDAYAKLSRDKLTQEDKYRLPISLVTITWDGIWVCDDEDIDIDNIVAYMSGGTYKVETISNLQRWIKLGHEICPLNRKRLPLILLDLFPRLE